MMAVNLKDSKAVPHRPLYSPRPGRSTGAIGDLNLLPPRPFSRQHVGFVCDTINLVMRLMRAAEPGQIVVSNSFYSRLGLAEKAMLQCRDPVEAKNIGLIRCWKAAIPAL